MQRPTLTRLTAIVLAFVLALQGIAPCFALAEQRSVDVDNHTVATDQTTAIRDVVIGDVDKPSAGSPLDQDATATASGDINWSVPVLWVRDDLQVENKATAQDGRTYLPVLAFFVPQEYSLAEDVYAVTLSDSLAELFGSQEIISVYDASTGITYILPASLKDLFARASRAEQTTEPEDAQVVEPMPEPSDEMPNPAPSATQPPAAKKSLVEIYCAQSARDALTDEDLSWLIDLIINYLEPQAVELLLNRFPAMGEAAAKGEIGKQLGLYIYYKKGDKDGRPGHNTPANALAYVAKGPCRIDGDLKFCYMLAVDVDGLIKKDEDEDPVRDPNTGTYVLVRDGKDMETLRNTIVHELFHALMDDYNRTGMEGSTNLADNEVGPNNQYVHPAAAERYHVIHYPQWFVEGTASAVENVYQYRYDVFQQFRRAVGTNGRNGMGDLNPTFYKSTILQNYLSGYFPNGDYAYLDLKWCNGGKDSDGEDIEPAYSRYVTGYLASLYIAELAARYNNGVNGSAIETVNGMTSVNASKLRDGLNSVLKWMHEGQTLDSVIRTISPKNASGQPIYKDTDSFANLFIKGEEQDGAYYSDPSSIGFVYDFLNYMLYVEEIVLPDDQKPNGSILFDLDRNFADPLDPTKKASSQYLQIVESNEMIPSTVSPDISNIGGGKSNPDQVAAASTTQPEEAQLPIAAKQAEAQVVQDDDKTSSNEPQPADTPTDTPASTPESASEPEPVASPEPTPEPTSPSPISASNNE